MRSVAVFLVIIFLAGCGPSGESGEKLTPEQEEAREKSVFWQFEEPCVQLDPIEEEEIPQVIRPTIKEEEQK